jgi:hypothetical protein
MEAATAKTGAAPELTETAALTNEQHSRSGSGEAAKLLLPDKRSHARVAVHRYPPQHERRSQSAIADSLARRQSRGVPKLFQRTGRDTESPTACNKASGRGFRQGMGREVAERCRAPPDETRIYRAFLPPVPFAAERLSGRSR